MQRPMELQTIWKQQTYLSNTPSPVRAMYQSIQIQIQFRHLADFLSSPLLFAGLLGMIDNDLRF